MDILQIGKAPIGQDSPAGSDARYDPEFEELQAEMDKLSSPTASGEMNWEKVSTLCQSILSQKSKDLLVASYFAVAQIQLRQIEGLTDGLKVFRDIVENFWESLFPPKKRSKGRVAAIEWWLERSEAALEKMEIPPLSTETLDQVRDDLKTIQAVLDEHLQEPPLLRPLERVIERIPAMAEHAATEAPSPQELETEARQPPPERPRQEVKKPQPPPSAQSEGISSTAEAEKILREAFKGVMRTADRVTALDPTDARSYRWRRMAGWAMIQQLPPAENGQTQVPQPPEHETVATALRDLGAKGNWQAMLQQAEEKLSTALLWLDLNRFAAEALSGLGDQHQAAHDAVCQETGSFIRRLPGIVELCYADGTPFADQETRQWLTELIPKGGESPGPARTAKAAAGDGETREALDQAEALARKKKLPEAVSLIQQQMQVCTGGRDRLIWRIGLARILMRAPSSGLVRPHLELILKDIDEFRLEEWDPGLALEGLQTVFRGLNAGKGKEESQAILPRIARLDAFEALQLGS